MLPNAFLSRLKLLLSSAAYDRAIKAFSTQRQTTFRINTLINRDVTLDFSLSGVPWYHDAFILNDTSLRDLTGTRAYKEGRIYVQSLSSMLPPLILKPEPGDKVLDIAAAPGSKTTQMAAMMENKGEIVANDTSHVRRYRLLANLAMQLVTIARIETIDGRALWKKYPEYFDKSLVDVPCSMEGRFAIHDPKSFRDWSPQKVKDLSRLQRWMLRSAISATKNGGTIVYSTCTLSPEENEEVIDWILKKEKGNIVLDDIQINGFHADPAVLQWGNKQYNPEIAKTIRVYPTSRMEGFYVAKIKKIKSTV